MDPNNPIALGFVVIATVSSFLMGLAPLPVMYDIMFQTKDVGVYGIDHYIFGIIFGTINGVYSMYSGHLVSFISCMICAGLFSSYFIIYVIYSKSQNRRALVMKLAACLGLAVFIDSIGPIVWLSVHEDGLFVNTWLGICACVSITLLYSGQLTNIIRVIKHKDARSISVFIMIGGLFAAIMWTVYAILVMDPYFLTANGLGVIAGITQLVLLVKYSTVQEETAVKDSLEA